MAEKQDAFTRAQQSRIEVDTLVTDIKRRKELLKKARAELAQHRKAVLVAMGSGKVRAPRKVKGEVSRPSPQEIAILGGSDLGE